MMVIYGKLKRNLFNLTSIVYMHTIDDEVPIKKVCSLISVFVGDLYGV